MEGYSNKLLVRDTKYIVVSNMDIASALVNFIILWMRQIINKDIIM